MRNKKEKIVSLWGRLGVQIDMTPEEFEVLKKNDVAARDLLVELIKSDRCSLSGETYFPPEPNEEYLADLDDYLEFDIGFQPLQSDEFEVMEQTLLEQRENPEIWALRGEISNLRHELDGALIYDPDYAPTIEKCLAVRELELDAALKGVELGLEPGDIIDAFDKIMLKKDKELAEKNFPSSLADNIAAAKQIKKDIPSDGLSSVDITR